MLILLTLACAKPPAPASPADPATAPLEAPAEPALGALAAPTLDDALAALDAELAPLRAAIPEAAPDDPAEVAGALAARVRWDQAIRTAQAPGDLGEADRAAWGGAIAERMIAADALNSAWLAGQLDAAGWPTISEHGEIAARDAWLLAQHADQDPALQRRILEAMTPLVAAGEARGEDLAYLWDRVAVNAGQPQRYATQGRCTGPGAWAPMPLEDAEGIDAIRAGVGLEPLADYQARFVDICEAAHPAPDDEE